jgi:hypothetical protein
VIVSFCVCAGAVVLAACASILSQTLDARRARVAFERIAAQSQRTPPEG